MTNRRTEILKSNEAIRSGNAPKPTRLPDGEVTFRIPDEDFPLLMKLFPELAQVDGRLRDAAWRSFAETPAAEPYLVVRPPAQVRRDNRRIITK